MGEHDDDLDVSPAADAAGQSEPSHIAAAVASGLAQVAAALEIGLREVAAAIEAAGSRPRRRR